MEPIPPTSALKDGAYTAYLCTGGMEPVIFTSTMELWTMGARTFYLYNELWTMGAHAFYLYNELWTMGAPTFYLYNGIMDHGTRTVVARPPKVGGVGCDWARACIYRKTSIMRYTDDTIIAMMR